MYLYTYTCFYAYSMYAQASFRAVCRCPGLGQGQPMELYDHVIQNLALPHHCYFSFHFFRHTNHVHYNIGHIIIKDCLRMNKSMLQHNNFMCLSIFLSFTINLQTCHAGLMSWGLYQYVRRNMLEQVPLHQKTLLSISVMLLLGCCNVDRLVISRNRPYIGGHLAIYFQIEFKHV